MDPAIDFGVDASRIYYDPRLAASLDSMEGVPDWPEVAETPDERSHRKRLQHLAHQVFEWIGTLLPGVSLAVLLAAIGGWLSHWLGTSVLGFAKTPISEISLATLLGLLIRNTVGLPHVYESGLRVSLRWILRGGIVLLGLRLSIQEISAIGIAGLPVIVACIAASLVLVSLINRALGLPRRLGSLIAVGTSICGVSAVVATAPLIEADDEEVSYAVACVTIFGMVALFSYPFLAHWLFADDARRAGIFLGTAIHDTAQVAGAGLMYQEQFAAPQALNAATVTKLVRNLCMAAVIPLVGVMYHRTATSHAAGKRRKWHETIPLFVVGFMLLAAVRSIGDAGDRPFLILEKASWQSLLADANLVSSWCLTVAMTAVGLGTGVAKLAKVGFKPLLVGLFAAMLVGAVSYTLIQLLAYVA